jgi:hypothetical protein
MPPEMPISFNMADYYRRRAAEVRALSADFQDPALRDLMARMASEYDDLARKSGGGWAEGPPSGAQISTGAQRT